jgi:hypothetical protein
MVMSSRVPVANEVIEMATISDGASLIDFIALLLLFSFLEIRQNPGPV